MDLALGLRIETDLRQLGEREYALGALKAAKRDTGIECEEFIDGISRCKLPGRFIAFMANAADEYLSKRYEKEES